MATSCNSKSAPSICAHCGSPCAAHCSHCAKVAYCSREHQKAHRRIHKPDCYPAQLTLDPVLGEHLAATRSIAAGEVIFCDQALLAGPRSNLPPGTHVCLGCHALASNHRCRRCKWPMCSAQCENAAWHAEYECPLLAKNAVRPPSGGVLGPGMNAHEDEDYLAITVLRALLMQRVSPSRWSQLQAAGFESHVDTRSKRTQCMEQVHRIVDFITNKCQVTEYDLRQIDLVYGWIVVNGYGDPTTFSVKLYPKGSKISNCCVPNTRTLSTDPAKGLQVLATVPIAAGAPITQLYGRLLKGTVPRQELFQSVYYFICSCARCMDPTELGRHFSSVRCGSIGHARKKSATLARVCEGFLLPTKGDAWKCDKCSKTRSYTTELTPMLHNISQSPALADLSDLLYSEYEVCDEKMDASTIFRARLLHVEAMLDVLQNMGSTLVHPNHYVLLPLKTALIATMHSLVNKYYGPGQGKKGQPSPSTLGTPKSSIQKMVDEFGRLTQELLEGVQVFLPGLTPERGILLFYKAQALRWSAALQLQVVDNEGTGTRSEVRHLEEEARRIMIVQPEDDSQRQLVLKCLHD